MIPVIFNPVSGQKSARGLWLERTCLGFPDERGKADLSGPELEEKIIASFKNQGRKIQIYRTERKGHACEIARMLCGQGHSLIVLAGGDGTLHEVVNGLGEYSPVTLGLLPKGTTNTFALGLGIPLLLEEAVRTICGSHTEKIDLGKLENTGNLFAMGAGAGLFSDVLKRLSFDFKKNWGSFSYLLAAVPACLAYRYPPFEVEAEEIARPKKAYLAVISNTPTHGGLFRTAPQADLRDGKLDIVLIQTRNIALYPAYIHTARWGDLTKMPGVFYFQSSRFRIQSAENIPLHLDAETGDHKIGEFRCLAGALKIRV